MGSFAPIIASQLNIKASQVQAVLDLFSEAATIPFIARYRKDKTGGLDEVQIQQIEEASKFLKTFTERKDFIEKAIENHQDKYDYSNIIYISSITKVKIICKKHGEFEQTPSQHLSGAGCNKCAQGSTKLCISHGGGRRCKVLGCLKGARDRNFCANHGGGRRCHIESCAKSAVGGSDSCTLHGGGKKLHRLPLNFESLAFQCHAGEQQDGSLGLVHLSAPLE
jgi:hypothetical protein